ncbi:amylo-alpha-1,6-glucosidase [Dactylosporangium sucinum]|uniref:Glycogen debranching protein n=1 Tax=Dactylosporangium sucinum TaxID=1424081 RepID=A0A917WI25_9ACTN|nr:amylo-alpha-1,6-glucosidase [Dactylosporangium sucinum]GGM06515.1 glycogen debranching protein [Dactylosporangium sucinum]
MITFGRQVCGDLDAAAAREWLVTDGLGGYATGTVAGLRTRRYHGLLVVAEPGGSARRLGLAALDPVVRVGERQFRLATDEWAGGAVDPAGLAHLASFTLDNGVPVWRWDLGDVVVEREIAMAYGSPTVGVVLRVVRAPRPVSVSMAPLCTWRDAHGERVAYGEPDVTPIAGGFEFEGAYRVTGPGWEPGGEWYHGVYAREEAARGLNPVEDLWAAGRFTATLEPGSAMGVTAGAGDGPLPAATALVTAARKRARKVARQLSGSDAVSRQLAVAADQFVVTTPTGPSAVAGYPWFGEWSRDLMTSFEGLFLTTNRHAEAREVLLRAGGTVSEGMLANTADTGTLEYNTADAALWFLHAIGRYVAVTDDLDTAASLADVMDEILRCHQRGTRYGIAADPADGLLTQGKPGFALTWMDARVDGHPVTDRHGKPVEINALWIEALSVTAELFDRLRRRHDWSAAAERATASFRRRFPRPDGAGLYDVVDGPGGDDASVRPNQLLAVGLPHAPVDDPAVVELCRAELLTSLGLRSLSQSSPSYAGHHGGTPYERDHAYHQGTVWPWLIGPFTDAAVRTGADTAGLLDGLHLHLAEWGLGSVSETADGDAPHAATGCPFQAWSVAELLRAHALLR